VKSNKQAIWLFNKENDSHEGKLKPPRTFKIEEILEDMRHPSQMKHMHTAIECKKST
jgi:hypothetical protein